MSLTITRGARTRKTIIRICVLVMPREAVTVSSLINSYANTISFRSARRETGITFLANIVDWVFQKRVTFTGTTRVFVFISTFTFSTLGRRIFTFRALNSTIVANTIIVVISI